MMLVGRKKQLECFIIPVSLDEPLTSDSCTKLIIELLKYILYEKQQIPFSYDTLAQLMQTQQTSRLTPTDRNSTLTKTLMSSLKNIKENLNYQFYSSNCQVREVLIMIGATTVSPKLSIRLELPDGIIFNGHFHHHQQHENSSRKPLLNLMRSIIDCQKFQEAMSTPLGVTNAFVLVEKRDSNTASNFFLPKAKYMPPTTQSTPCFVVKFTINENSSIATSCNCANAIKVYHDSPHDSSSSISHDTTIGKLLDRDDFPYLWYQSREVIRGFKFSG